MKKIIILAITLMCFSIFNQEPFAADDLDFSSEISFEEMQDFLEIYSTYNKKHLYENKYEGDVEDISLTLSTDQQSLEYNHDLINWLGKRNWQVDRFFYCEKRLNDIIKAKILRDTYLNSKPMLEMQIEDADRNKALLLTLKANLDMLKEAPYKTGITDSEMDMVSNNFEDIKDILSGKAYFKP